MANDIIAFVVDIINKILDLLKIDYEFSFEAVEEEEVK